MNANFIEQLAAVGALAPSPDNAQPWFLSWNGKQLAIIYADRHKAHSVFRADSHATLLSVGAVAENLQSALLCNGVAGAWTWAADAGQGTPYGALAIQEVPDRFTAPDGALRRHTNRLAYRSDPLPADLIGKLDHYREGNNHLLLLRSEKKAALVRQVRICSEARFCNRQLHEWLMASLRFTPQQIAQGDGLDIHSLGLPPGGGQFLRFIADWNRLSMLNRFGAYKLLALSEVAPLSVAPALLCLIGRADQRSVIDAGMLMTRIWTELNLQGIAVQPYYVVSDQIKRRANGTLVARFGAKIAVVEQEVAALLALQQGEILHMILRVGYPKTEAPRSRRLPLAVVFLDASAGPQRGA
ncbi:nitroreductase [Oxalobacteraceae bacterium GrIS 1.11]